MPIEQSMILLGFILNDRCLIEFYWESYMVLIHIMCGLWTDKGFSNIWIEKLTISIALIVNEIVCNDLAFFHSEGKLLLDTEFTPQFTPKKLFILWCTLDQLSFWRTHSRLCSPTAVDLHTGLGVWDHWLFTGRCFIQRNYFMSCETYFCEYVT